MQHGLESLKCSIKYVFGLNPVDCDELSSTDRINGSPRVEEDSGMAPRDSGYTFVTVQSSLERNHSANSTFSDAIDRPIELLRLEISFHSSAIATDI
jgi:hypothetical protein